MPGGPPQLVSFFLFDVGRLSGLALVLCTRQVARQQAGEFHRKRMRGG